MRSCRINSIAIAELMLGLQDACHSMHDLAEMSGLSIQTVRNYCKALHKRGVAHIADWTEDAKGGRTLKVFALGTGVDMKKPKPQSKAQACAKWRAKQRHQLMVTRLAANTNQFKEAA